MAATLITISTSSGTIAIALDYSSYFDRIAAALETIAVSSSATSQTLVTIANTSSNISATLSNISNFVNTIAVADTSTTTTNILTQLLTTASFIGLMLESIASVNATSAATISGVVPTFKYAGVGFTTSTAAFMATVGGTTGTTMYVNTISSGVIVPNMIISGTYTNNVVNRQTSGETGSTGTYELLYNTGYRISLNQGNSPSFSVTGTYTTGSISSITSTNILTTLQQITL